MRKRRFCLWASLFLFCMTLLVAAAVHAAERYRVRSGDNLYKIAKKFHVRADAIREINHLDGDALKVNQVLVIPGGTPAKKAAQKPHAKNKLAADTTVYVVRQGDTLAGIAAKTGMPASEIRSANRLTSSKLRAGQRLVVANLPARALGDENDLEEAGSIEADELALAGEEAGKEGGLAPFSLSRWNSPGERDLFVRVVKSYEGVPYRLGGNSLRGIDCSAFTRKIYSIFSIDLPRTAREQLRCGKRVGRDDLDTGDLVFFKTRRNRIHVGIFLGGSEFFHLSSVNRAGKVDNINSAYFSTRFVSGVRLMEAEIPEKDGAPKGPGIPPASPAPAVSPSAVMTHPPEG